jgi:hypothetical protein
VTAEAALEIKPYKGPLSYEIEDTDYFFGRERESDLLAAKILSTRFTLLHAQSGTGKTSLLNARVIPALEEQSWTAFRILPRLNPTEAVRLAVLMGTAPPPSTECAALDRLLAQFWNPGDDPTLEEILRRFDHEIPRSDPRRRLALMPLTASINIKSAALSFAGEVRPLFLRLLRATLELSQYEQHLRILLPHAPDDPIDGTMRASALRRLLSDPASGPAHEDLLTRLYIPSPSLRAFFANLLETYGERRTQFGLVLILDQFEELFTLFSDSLVEPGKELWRLRWEFIEQLEDLYKAGAALPIRYVISMRDEYIAQLDPLRRFVRDLDATAFHLSFLEKDDARAAVREPARLFGYDYSEECYRNIFEVLVREDRFVEPAPLQIVCERLWREQGKALAMAAGSQTRTIQFASFPAGGTRAILDSFFDEAIDSLEEPAERLEMLEMLEPLVTSRGTRNIVERNSLVNAPFRKASRRGVLLDNLAKQRIVRVEQRLGGQFVEITHEFLIASILRKIRTVLNPDPVYSRFRWAVRTLERFEDVDFRSGSRQVLGRSVFVDLDTRRDEIEWNDWAIELMLRSAVVAGAATETIHFWAERYTRSGEENDPARILAEDRIRDQGRRLLSLEELAAVNAAESSGWTAEQIEFIFRSQIQRGGAESRAQMVRWTEELKRLCSETRS